MCGINGFLYFKKNSNISRERNRDEIRAMNAKIYHRGPDESGIFADETGAIGMTRLSIIDLKTGSQPIANEDGRFQIVFNGEIYNFREVRERLIARGHVFKTHSDTETILHAYEEFGEDCVVQLLGMFAFAIYDTQEHSFFLARDRVGEKPLYYAKLDDRFVFASELKSIFALGNIPKKIDKTALTQFLTLTYIPAPRTILESVSKLPAAHTLRVSANGEISSHEYWDTAKLREEQIEDYNECKRRLRATLFDAVEKCMVSDVPVGTFLSGGIDSTVITGIASKISKTPVETFTIGLRDKASDESPLAQITSQFLGTKHRVHVVDYADMLENIDALLENMDEPFADSSLIPTFAVSKMARKNVKVILTGDAGDELFAGYNKYLIGHYSELYNRIPKILRKQIIERIVYALPDTSAAMRKIRKVLDNASGDIFEQRRAMMCLGIAPKRVSNLVSFQVSVDNALDFIRERYECGMRNGGGVCEIDRTLYTDLKVILEGDMLCKVDRASMFASLETRVPMLYPSVVELATKIPAKFKICGNKRKLILKDTFSDLIPSALLSAPKRGFVVPVAEWLRNEMRTELTAELSRERLDEHGLFNAEFVENLLSEHFSMKKNNSGILWALFVFQKWFRRFGIA